MKLSLNGYAVYHLPHSFAPEIIESVKKNPVPTLAGILNYFVEHHPKQILVESSGSAGVSFAQLTSVDIDNIPFTSMKKLRRYFDMALMEMQDAARKPNPDPQAGYMDAGPMFGVVENDQVLDIIEAFPNLLGLHLPRFHKPRPPEVLAKENDLQEVWVRKESPQFRNTEPGPFFPMFGDPGWEPGGVS